MIRKWIGVLLVMAMLVSAMPLQALSVNVTNESQVMPAGAANKLQTLTIVNPEYAHLVSVEDIVPPEYGKLDYGNVSYLTEEEAAAAVREAMKKRETAITVNFYTYETDVDTGAFIPFLAACTHTGKPTEGDYLSKHYRSCSVDGGYLQGTVDGAAVLQFQITYTVTYMTNAEQEAQMDTAVAALLTSLNLECADDYTKFITVYDYICANITYDYDNLSNGEYLLKHSAYAALVNKTAVCQGYALLLYRLMLELGVDCRYISGTAFNGVENGSHGWNIVELDGKYYNVDSTWDAGNYDYLWCLQSQENFIDHFRDAEYDTAEFHSEYPMGTADYIYSGDGSPKHSYTAVVTPPTCTEKGYTTYTCQVCDDSHIADYTDALGHNYVEGVCAACEAIQIIASGTCGDNLTWVLDGKGTLTISGTGKMDDYDFQSPWSGYGSSIKTAVIENGVTSIGSWAFGRCTGMTSVTIPASVTTIDYSAFATSSGLTGIWVDADNTAYCSDSDGVLFNKNKTALLRLPGAWSGSYTIPDAVTTIGEAAFWNSTGLTDITIPDSVTNIQRAAFSGCTGLSNVIYCGTQQQWTQISVGEYNDSLLNATLHTKATTVYGDATGDGIIDGMDVIRLKKYLANYNYETETSTIEISAGADATGDGIIDGMDVIRLKKYLANYNYETGESTIPLGPQ